MVTGALPFRGESAGIIFNAILERPPVSPLRLNPDLPPKLEDIINKALDKDRNLRYQHAADMRTDLQRLKRDSESGRSSAASSGTVALAEAPADQSFQATLSAVVASTTAQRTKQVVILMAVVAVVAVASYFVLRNRGKEAQSIRSIRSMAVLPFKSIGAADDEQYIGAGIADALTTKLSGVSQLKGSTEQHSPPLCERKPHVSGPGAIG